MPQRVSSVTSIQALCLQTHHLSIPFTVALGLADGGDGHSRALLSHVPMKGWLLVSRFLPLVPRDSEGLGQAAVLHVAGVGTSVRRGDFHHHPGLVSAIFTEMTVSP